MANLNQLITSVNHLISLDYLITFKPVWSTLKPSVPENSYQFKQDFPDETGGGKTSKVMYLLFVFKALTYNNMEWSSRHLFHFTLQIHRLKHTHTHKPKEQTQRVISRPLRYRIPLTDNSCGISAHSKASFQAFLEGFSQKSSELAR